MQLNDNTIACRGTGRRFVAAIAVLVACVVASGCSTGEVEEALGVSQDCDGPVVYLLVDNSRSTAGERRPGGLYQKAAMKVLDHTARECGSELYAAPFDGNAIGDANWEIDGKAFHQQVGGNSDLGAAARVQQAKRYAPKVRRLLNRPETRGTDPLGALQRVQLANQDRDDNQQTVVVMLTDGAIVARGRNLYRQPPIGQRARKKLIADLKRADELPDLRGVDAVYLAGVGLGVENGTTARAIIRLWQHLIHATGSQLESIDSTLKYP